MSDGDGPDDKPWLADAETCRQLRVLAASKKTRTVAQMRHRWEPGTVRDPSTGEMFDTESAWRFISELLEKGAEVEVIPLDFPPGKKGYVLFAPGVDGRRIYIKLQFFKNLVAGRSFHISDEEGRDR